MKKFFLLGSLILSTSAFAISDDKLVEACLEKGKEKLQVAAINNLCLLDATSVHASNVDNVFYNSKKGITYTGTIMCFLSGDKIISQPVQYYKGTCQ
ncbi:MAG: hypothetical protein K2Q18_13900 [Bdellovibrionales bacterium]|nr:hypothetical protein [Bdellovibrionales bacterium]